MAILYFLWCVLALIGGFFGARLAKSKVKKRLEKIPDINKGIDVIEYEIYRFNKSLKEGVK